MGVGDIVLDSLIGTRDGGRERENNTRSKAQQSRPEVTASRACQTRICLTGGHLNIPSIMCEERNACLVNGSPYEDTDSSSSLLSAEVVMLTLSHQSISLLQSSPALVFVV
jgi:hypothetical protein